MPHRLALLTVTLLIALAGARAAHADVRQAPLSAAEADRLVAFLDELVDTAARHAADCAAQAGAVDGVVTRHLNALQMMWAAKKANKGVPRDVQGRLNRRSKEMVDALRKCWDDQGVKAAFKRMKPPSDKKP
jgi:hypothetical protein